MATAEQIKSLVKAYTAHDDEKFKTVVLQIAAHEAKLGHGSIAQELKNAANSIGKNSMVLKLPSMNNSMLDYTMPSVEIKELVVSESVLNKLNRILMEYRNKNKLYKNGLSNRRKILLEGNPGTGKTMSASIIAAELGLPLFTVQVDKMVTKFMGETSIRLRQIFESMSTTTGVYLFDEFDAIGADRSLDNEVGEMRRILNSFLQFIETDVSDSIIIAATNNQKILDKALFRRFDDVIHYDLPDDDQIQRLFSLKLEGYVDKGICSQEVIKTAHGLSHAELSLVCDDVIKESILYGTVITQMMIVSLLNERHRVYQGREA
ncbi:MAG: ATP-binding protein [Clostridia bacterium]|nr:ATP-binding protein [Clostridia bacterium]